MSGFSCCSSGRNALMLLAAMMLLALTPGTLYAHEFIVSLRAVGAEREVILRDALRGFLLATVEQDGHENEESNGHLGGLDVYIIPRPDSIAARLPELKAAPDGPPDIVAVIGEPADVTANIATISDESLILRPGLLHQANSWTAEAVPDPDSFPARYLAAYGQPASQWAARGYNAARRIDSAVRPLGGVNDRAALDRAFAQSALGIRW